MKHPNAEWIKLFVDGVEVEWRLKNRDDVWDPVVRLDTFDSSGAEFRRTPKRKKYRVAKLQGKHTIWTATVNNEDEAASFAIHPNFVHD